MAKNTKTTDTAGAENEASETLSPTVSESTVAKTADAVEDYPLPKGHALLVSLDKDGKEIPGSEFTVLWNASAVKNYGDETQFKTKKKPTTVAL